MQSVYQNTLWFLKLHVDFFPLILKSNTINTNYFTTVLKTVNVVLVIFK